MSDEHERCPHCQADLRYEHEGRMRSHAILIEVSGVYDGGLFYMCRFCDGPWHRWPEGHHLRAKAQQYLDTWKARRVTGG